MGEGGEREFNKLEAEKEMKKLELDADRENEERTQAIRLRKLELQEWEIEAGQRSGPSESRSDVENVRLRLLFFDESKDDVNTYLKGFERLAQLQHWEKKTG